MHVLHASSCPSVDEKGFGCFIQTAVVCSISVPIHSELILIIIKMHTKKMKSIISRGGICLETCKYAIFGHA